MTERLSPYVTGCASRCPECGKGALFKGLLTPAPACSECGFDYSIMDTGDGPAVFAIFIIGALVVGGALVVELAYQPSYWVHALLWTPLIIILPLVLLRVLKSLMFSLQVHHKAMEMRIDHEE